MPGVVNPDGTVQVSPPLASAFAPQAGQPPPPPQGMQPAAPQPGFVDALMQMLQQLTGALKPGGAGNASGIKRVDDAVDQASK